MNRLFNLLRNNAKRSSIRAAANEITIEGVIVADEMEAEWFGGVAPAQVARALAGMTGPVTMRINSPGGDAIAARAIAQRMREYEGDITVQVDGYAASAASVIAIAGARVVMAPGSLMMIHKAWTFALGNADEFMATAALLEKVDGQLADTYAARGQGDAAHYAELMGAETWFTPAEAVAEGLADEALPETKAKSAAAALAAFDVSAYDRAPPAPAVEPPAEPPAPTLSADDRDRMRRQLAVRLRA